MCELCQLKVLCKLYDQISRALRYNRELLRDPVKPQDIGRMAIFVYVAENCKFYQKEVCDEG